MSGPLVSIRMVECGREQNGRNGAAQRPLVVR